MNKHKYFSTNELIENVALKSCNISLNEILSSRKLIILDGQRYIFPEYLWNLRERDFRPFIFIRHNETKLDEKIDATYDLTLQKFSVLKSSMESKENEEHCCDNQYKELYRKLNQMSTEAETISSILLEHKIGKILRNMVIRHLRYSWLEVCRKLNHSYHRYRWELEDETIELMKPQWIKGNEFRKWLEINILNDDEQLNLNRGEVQKRIYDWFGYAADINLDDDENVGRKIPAYDDPIEKMNNSYIGDKFFVQIALEKSCSSQLLRPSIRDLGEDKIYELVHSILMRLAHKENNDDEISKEFELSKATYSRFAGRDWMRGGIFEIPDLWKNITKVVASDPVFIELAIESGVMEIIDLVLKIEEMRS